jgi:hypothetical protein
MRVPPWLRACRIRNDSPSVTTTMLWCSSRSSRLAAVVCSGRKRPHWSKGVPLPAVDRECYRSVRMTLPRLRGSASLGGPNDRCPQAVPAVGMSGPRCPPARAGRSWLAAQTSRPGVRRPPTPVLRAATAGFPRSPRRPAAVERGHRGQRGCPGGCGPEHPAPLSAAASRTMAGCPDGCCPLWTLRPATGSGCPAGVR